MKAFSETDPLDSGCSGDFAQIETDGQRIVLEANEWDTGCGGFRSVTLWLTTGEALSLAGRLARTVLEIESARISRSPSA